MSRLATKKRVETFDFIDDYDKVRPNPSEKQTQKVCFDTACKTDCGQEELDISILSVLLRLLETKKTVLSLVKVTCLAVLSVPRMNF